MLKCRPFEVKDGHGNAGACLPMAPVPETPKTEASLGRCATRADTPHEKGARLQATGRLNSQLLPNRLPSAAHSPFTASANAPDVIPKCSHTSWCPSAGAMQGSVMPK